MVLVYFLFDFPAQQMGENLVKTSQALAQSISQEPGFIRKYWIEDAKSEKAGGVYLFADRTSAEAYVVKHTARAKQWGATQVESHLFDVNAPLSKITLCEMP